MNNEEYEMVLPNKQASTKKSFIETSKLKTIFNKIKTTFNQSSIKKKLPGPPRDIYIFNNNTINNVKFINNKVSTSKYNFITFLPKFLFEQFSNYANIFFLFISCIQQIDGITPTSRYTTLAPLIIVLIFTAIKEFAEDFKRHKSDSETNNRNTKIFNTTTSQFEIKKWDEAKVGDVVRIENGESFPADLVLISSSEPEGLCYIETCNLDGETNLKVKQSLTETAHLISPEVISKLKGSIKSEGPNDSLYTYSGTLYIEDSTEIPLSTTQILLRGAMLRNTNWIYGIVIFTGHDTKLMRNASAAPIKRTNVVKMTNTQILFLFIILIILSVFCASGSIYLKIHKSDNFKYLSLSNGRSNFTEWIRNVLTFMILFNNLIPISLIVTMEVVKYNQAELINSDLDMYYEPTDTPALARTSSLVEELGQVEYIFSDKTGTLTCNQMEFKECSIQGIAYAEVETNEKRNFGNLKKESFNSNYYIKQFFYLLSTCHTVIPETKEGSNEIIYQASSPDESALVKGAAGLGFRFIGRKPKSILISVENENGELVEELWEVLNICEFNSTRKRMSTILKTPDGTIKLFCKGADTVILERLSKNGNEILDITLQHLEDYANVGLRTLCLAYRDIPQSEYDVWSEKFNKAANSIINRQDALDEVAELIEKDFTLLGATAIEDKLQDGVPETIHTLSKAGIKIWVLTGDRQETAINIGYSCKLIRENMTVWVCNEESLDETRKFIESKLMLIEDMKKENNIDNELVFVIDGKSLDYALEKSLEMDFYKLAINCKAVVCCRVSPLQKALIVKCVKKKSESILLAIGDGANDVSMIQAAHIGVGINGQEGLQAARSSDFAISQFRFLKKLLLVHGAWSYHRLSKLILYSFYKNITLYMTQFWYTFYNGFSGQTLYESWTNTAYNVVFTVMPPLMIGIFDQYLSAATLDKYPELYKIGQKRKFFNVKTFWGSTLNAIYHSVLLFFFIYLAYKDDVLLQGGYSGNYGNMSITLYSCVLLTVLLKAGLITSHWTKFAIIAIPGSFAIWLVYVPVYTTIAKVTRFAPEYSGVGNSVYSSPIYWLILILLPIICLLRDYIWKYSVRVFKPRTYHYIQEIQKFNIIDYRPNMDRFKKAVDKARIIQKLRRTTTRGYAFSQNESGETKIVNAYDTTKSKPKG